MRHHRVPGLSVAVFTDYRLQWAKGYGSADASSGEPVTATTLFQAGSISKSVSAMAALKAVERGELALDVPVNDVLETWKLPENELTRKSPVTLRHPLKRCRLIGLRSASRATAHSRTTRASHHRRLLA